MNPKGIAMFDIIFGMFIWAFVIGNIYNLFFDEPEYDF